MSSRINKLASDHSIIPNGLQAGTAVIEEGVNGATVGVPLVGNPAAKTKGKVKMAEAASGEATGQAPPTIIIPRPKVACVEVGIVGTAPLIVHRWSKKAREMLLAKQMKKANVGKQAKVPEEDFNESRYISTAGWDGLPAVAFKAAMVDASRQVDGLTMTLAKRLFFVEHQGVSQENVGLVRIVGEPTMREDMVRLETGVADIRFRAMYFPWSAILTIRFNASIISAEQAVNLLALAGISEGVGEGRPSAPKSKTGENGLWMIQE